MASPTLSQDLLVRFSTPDPDYNKTVSLSRSMTDSDSSSSGVSTGGSETKQNVSPRKCPLCHEIFTNPRVMPCLHTFCYACLENNQERPGKITCSSCHQEYTLTDRGISGLLPDFTVNGVTDIDPNKFGGVCKSCNLNTHVVAYCYDCQKSLCASCMIAHQSLNCYEDHRLHSLTLEAGDGATNALVPTGVDERVVFCFRHKNERLEYFCLTCNVPVCKECMLSDHQYIMHGVERLSDIGVRLLNILNGTVQESKAMATDIRNMVKNFDDASNKLQVRYHKAQREINVTFEFYQSMIAERKQELLKEVERVYSAKQLMLNEASKKGLEVVDKVYQTGEFVNRLTKNANVIECLLFKKLLDSKLQSLMSYKPDNMVMQNIYDLEFVSNYQTIQACVRNTFGYVWSKAEVEVIGSSKQPPIARPTTGSLMNGNLKLSNSVGGPADLMQCNSAASKGVLDSGGVIEGPYSSGMPTNPILGQYNNINILSKRLNSMMPFSASSIANLGLNDINGVAGLNDIQSCDKWSNGDNCDIFQNSGTDFPMNIDNNDSILNSSSSLYTASLVPIKSQIKRQKMIYNCKFGEFGTMEGQFTEPSGVAVNAQDEIIVADTNNHRIQIFDKEGRFKFQFGECGKNDGQLLYPNRVAVVIPSGDIVVTERSPTHQIQIYNQYGQFVRKFGASILQHPRGITVDNKGRIVVVECKVMRVIIFDQIGNVLVKFGCSKQLEFPNGVVVNDNQEIFISDNRAHCVKVFNYEGHYLRQIGGRGVTNYPIAVCITASDEIIIADNHNNFNLSIFNQDGRLVSALESKVKHAQCFDVALLNNGSVALASKDYRLYIYRYIQVPLISM